MNKVRKIAQQIKPILVPIERQLSLKRDYVAVLATSACWTVAIIS